MTGMLRFLPDAGRELDLVARAHRDLLQGRHAAARHVEELAAALFQLGGKGEALRQVPAALDPVGGRDAHAHHHLRRYRRADRIEHLQREAHAVLERAAVVVGALVGQRRQELVQQIAMGAVDLDRVQAQRIGAARGGHEAFLHALQAGGIQRQRHGLALRMRHVRRGDGLPAALAIRRDVGAALPRHFAGGLAAGVAELDRDLDRRVLAHGVDDRLQRRRVLVGPQAQVVGRDASLRRHRGGLDDQEAGAGQGQVAQVDHVPVGRHGLRRRSIGTSGRWRSGWPARAGPV
jgi:hypothetical protein